MSDWRWVTQVSHPGALAHSVVAPASNGMWIDLDGVDSIMPYNAKYHPARTRLGWMTRDGWHFLFVAEQIDPTQPGEANHNNPQGASNADNALEPTQVR